MISRLARQLRLEWRSLWEFFLLPGFVALWPYPLGFWWLKQLARYPGLYRQAWEPALAHAPKYLDIGDPKAFAYKVRITQLTDHADYWWSRTRGKRLLATQVGHHDAFAQLPSSVVGCFFHWGAGLWAVRAMCANGSSTAPFARPFDRASMGGAYLAHAYAKLRFHEFARIAKHPLIYPPQTLKQAHQALTEGGSVMGAPDIPPEHQKYSQPSRAFGRPIRFTNGLMSLAHDSGFPLVVLVMMLDEASGKRMLRTWGPFASDDPALVDHVVHVWEQVIRDKPWAFTLWPWLEAFFHAADIQENVGLDADTVPS